MSLWAAFFCILPDVVGVVADNCVFSSRCPWPRGSTTCPTPSCWTSSLSLRGWAKWITSTRSSSTKGPRANSVQLLISARTKKKKKRRTKWIMHTPARPQHQLQLSLPTRTQTASQLTEPSPSQCQTKIMIGRLQWLWRRHHCHLLVKQKTAWKLPCNFLPISLPWTSWCEWVNGWMDECLKTFLRCHRTCSRVNKAEVCSHESSGHSLGTGRRLLSWIHVWSCKKMQDLISRNQVERNFWKGLRANKLDQSCHWKSRRWIRTVDLSVLG